ncbi:MAG: uroporphyrinogen decarboxylase family protein [Candidatus Coatesbacteria bacterium]
MTGRERIARILKRQPVDRIGLFEHLWGDTHKAWVAEGKLKPDENIADHFGFDLEIMWPFNGVANPDHVDVVLAEDERTITARDGNGAVLKRHKLHDTTPEHIDFLVKDRSGWDEHIRPYLKAERRRINFEGYRATRDHAARRNNFFCWSGINVFEQMHPVCGHMAMLEGMIEDPDWIHEMVSTYADWTIAMMEILFAEEGKPDGVWFYEDMGFKHKPFMSPAMYREFIFPAHQKTIAYVKSLGLPVIMHSCGFVEPLLPGMVEAGIDCLQVIEVKAGMDLLRIYREFGDRLSLMGGIDVRVLYSNDARVIEAELLAKIPVVKGRNGYVLHSDHSIPTTVKYDSYRRFVDRALELGRY